MKDVVLDTNFTVLPHTHKLDIYAELERMIPEKHRLIVLSGTIRELETLAEARSETAVGAHVALQLLKRKDVAVVSAGGVVDNALISYAEAHPDAIVCTNDKRLKQRLKRIRVAVVSLKGDNTLICV